ncbi:MAG: DMT family transporter [Actinobacteria bacterium]|nr:DMT family transporter [Actinomycetota bacterium]
MAVNRYVALAVLGAIWGGTFVLITVSIRAFEPEGVLGLRMVLGALTAAPFAFALVGVRAVWESIRTLWWKMIVTAVFTFSAPTLMLAWAQERIDSGLAGVLVAGAPLFTALLALRFARHDTVSGLRLVGLLVGFVGVALLVGVQPSGDVLAAAVVALVGLSYAFAGLFTVRWFGETSPFVATLGMFLLTAVVMLPISVPRLPDAMPDGKVIAAMIGLGVGCTGIGLIIYVSLVARHGMQFGVLVNYLVPAGALGYGAAFLGESITPARVGGLVLVLLGVGLGSGLLRRRPSGRTATQPQEL